MSTNSTQLLEGREDCTDVSCMAKQEILAVNQRQQHTCLTRKIRTAANCSSHIHKILHKYLNHAVKHLFICSTHVRMIITDSTGCIVVLYLFI